ncbi:uncharacterized protein LOC135464154 isoform X2 [Liolophura sinensis]|uniref:uncharacterized protein LOC135464154 isoform X2 n=1 Tax=Liolophura sinensis TaxID=3198878 RepID=UPI003158A215
MGKLDIDMLNYPYGQGGLFNAKKSNVSSELTKTIRQKWENVEKPARYVVHKVTCRTSDQLILAENKSCWTKNYKRRQQNLQIGFFNPIQRPYQCLGGDFTLDPKELIQDVYNKTLSKKSKERPVKNKCKDDTPTCISSMETEPPSTGPKPSQSEDEDITHLSLWEHVHESNNQVRFVCAGQQYHEANKLIMEMRGKRSRSDLQTPNMMAIKSVTSLVDLNIGKTCAIDILSIPRTDSTEVDQTEGEGPSELCVPTAMKAATSRTSESQLRSTTSRLMEIYERERRERVKLDQMQKLEAIYMILLTLTNMKTSFLRNKTPLSRELLAVLKKEHPCDRDLMSRLASGRYSTNHPASVSTDTLISMETHSPNRTVALPLGPNPDLRPAGLTPVPVAHTPAAPQRRMTTFGNSPRAIGLLGAASMWAQKARKVTVDTVETWEDLVYTPDKQQRLFSKLQITGMFLGAMTKRRIPESDERKLPLWQIVANEKSHISPQKRRSREPQARLKQFEEDYLSLKAALARENRTELYKLDRERLALFEFKFNVLEKLPRLYQQHNREMRRALRNFSYNADNMEIQPSEWFQKLKEDTEAACPNDEDIQNMIRKMGRFSQMDSKTVLQAKAKLCMLMMSLPAYEICRVTVQQAFRFVLEEILLGNLAQFERWLRTRKLPMVLIDVK